MDRTDQSQFSTDDAVLVSAVASHDESALREIYQRYGNVVLGLATRILGDANLAEDVAQEVFVQLWKTADRFDPARGKLRTLLLTLTHGKCVDVIRTRNARAAREDKVHTSERSLEPSSVDAEIMAITETELIRSAVLRLAPDERIPLELAYFGGNTYRQVAVILGLPEGTVKARIRSGLRHLHGFLAEKDWPSQFSTHRKDTPWTAS